MILRLTGKILFCLLFCLSVFSCKDKNNDVIDPSIPKKDNIDRTIFVYISAENSLAGFSQENIDDMKKGLESTASDLNLIVYEEKSLYSYLWKLYNDGNGEVIQEMVATYYRKNSADKEFLAEMINYVFKEFPAKEKGLILWSHGTGWLPSANYVVSSTSSNIQSNDYSVFIDDLSSTQKPIQYSFGEDNYHNSYMEIWDLREALESTGIYFDFIAFDACHMSSIEVAYELKDVTSDIMASPAEIMGDGFPYNTIVELWQQEKFTVGEMCQKYYELYQEYSGTIAWIKTEHLEELRKYYSRVVNEFPYNFLNSTSDDIQQYGRSRIGYGNVFFDIEDVVRVLVPEMYDDFAPIMDKLVPYAASTENFLELPIDLDSFSGISVFVPEFKQNNRYHDAYMKLRWYDKVYVNRH